MWSQRTRQLVELACEEDLGLEGDITSALLPEGAAEVVARLVPREPGVLCGLQLGPTICELFSKRLGRALEFGPPAEPRSFNDGDVAEAGTAVATVRGALSAVLAVERTLLNFLGRMSGIATYTQAYVVAARAVNPEIRVLDTRKTLPGWRELDRYAVRIGGARNHRDGLYDAVLFKDNHLAGVPLDELAETLTDWLTGLRSTPKFIEVEVDGLDQFAEVCQVSAVDVVLLDNFTPEQLRAAVQYRDAHSLRGKLALEASGGITLETVAMIAETGIDRISIGDLTHSVAALDIGLDL